MGVIPLLSSIDDLAETIAVPNPNRPVQNAVGEFGRTVCERFSANPAAFSIPPIGPSLELVCKPYLDAQGYSLPEVEVPFTGGQCATSYAIYLTRRNTVTGAAGTEFLRGYLTGPLTVTQVEPAPDCGEDAIGVPAVFIHNVNQAPRDGFSVNPSANGACVLYTPNTTIRVARADSGADNCGDPAGTYIPGPSPAPDPGPLPPDTGPQIDIRGNPVLVLPPIVNVTGEVNIGFDIGEVNFGKSGGIGDEPPAPAEEQPGPNDGTGGSDDDFGDPPNGERWVGCCITISSQPVGFGVIPQSVPNDSYPTVVGNARLLFDSGEATAVDTAIRILGKQTCLWEPTLGLRPTGVFVNLLPGFTYTRTAYSVPE